MKRLVSIAVASAALVGSLIDAVPAGAQTPTTDVIGAITDAAWTVPDEPAVFGAGELDGAPGLPNGMAEVVRDYGFRRLSVFSAQSGGDTGVDARIYEMTDSAAAFGLFGLLRDRTAGELTPAALGTEGFVGNGDLHIWQANYVLVLSGARTDSEQLAQVMTAAILGDSRKPPVSNILPRRNLIADSEQYLLNARVFSEVTGLDPEALGFQDSVEVAVGEYRDATGDRARLALLLYPNSHLATKHLESWTSANATLPAYEQSGPAVAIALDDVAPGASALADSVLGDVVYRSEVTWNESLPDPLTLSSVILTVFSWIGIALAFTTVVGIGFGGVRIYMKTRYPDRFMGTSPDAEYIQLKLGQSLTDGQTSRRPALEAQTKQNQ